MGNWDLDIGDRYFQRTIYDAREFFAEVFNEAPAAAEPSRFKLYRGVERYPLSQCLPLRLGDARTSFEEFACRATAASADVLDADLLATLLYYTYGLSRRDEGPGAVWPLHRLVPSARCLFPTELYVWIPAIGEIPAGVYHYDPLHHHLALLRPGDYRGELACILGADLEGARCVLLVSSFYWKNAYKYRGYSYRLCTQEAGMVVGNALIVGGALGLRGQVHYQFLDEPGARLPGLDTSEEQLLAAVAFYSAADAGARSLRPRQAAPADLRRLERIAPISPDYVRADGAGHDLGQLFAGITQNSLLGRGGEFPREPNDSGATACSDEPGETISPPDPAGQALDLARVLRSRNSGNVLFNPVAAWLPAEAFWEIVRYALSPYVCDLRANGSAISLSLYVAVFGVEGMPAGVYRWCPSHGGLHVVDRGDVSRLLQGVMAVPNLNLCASSLVLYIAGSYPAASRTFGNRGYRILMMEAGLVAQRICVMCAAFGRSARIHNGYDARKVEAVLKIADGERAPLFQIAVGCNRPGLQYALPIVF